MDDNDRDQFVDELLDAALARHSNVEPRPGLEERLLAGVREAEPRAPWLGWRWVPVAAAAVMAVMAGALLYSLLRPAPAPPAVALAPRPEAAVQPSEPARAETSASVAPSPVSVPPVRQPRRDQFPSPAPLSAQERLLLLFVAENPLEALTTPALVGQPSQPVRIEPVHIQPVNLEPNEPKTIEN